LVTHGNYCISGCEFNPIQQFEMSSEAVNDRDFLLPPKTNIQSLDAWHCLVAIANLLLISFVAVDSVRFYRRARTWATFFLARLGVAGFIFQMINVTCLCFVTWPPAYGVRIMWFMGPVGTLANLALNVWRVRIFELVLPRQVATLLQAKYVAPVLSLICFICCLPMYFWIFNPDLYASSPRLMNWANYGFTIWINFWVIADVICAIVSLRKVSEVVINGRELYAKRCKILLAALIVSDAFSLVEDCMVAVTKGFPYPRESLSILGSLAIFHIAVSYFYMVNIVKYVVDTSKGDNNSRKGTSIPSSPKATSAVTQEGSPSFASSSGTQELQRKHKDSGSEFP
jgi:hypothetical protein